MYKLYVYIYTYMERERKTVRIFLAHLSICRLVNEISSKIIIPAIDSYQ